MKTSTVCNYCTGCGACVSDGFATLELNDKGFKIAKPKKKGFNDYCNKICFSSGNQYKGIKSEGLWGNILLSKYAWASDSTLRHKGSSGGTLTALCIYLLESGKVDGIVHVKEDELDPIETVCTLSTTKEEIVSHSGSRYSSSSPLNNISDYLGQGKRYCFVGKPCDVATLRNIMKIDERYKETFVVLLSFFCAGAPSVNANESLLAKMGIDRTQCVSLRYRGDGWPGYATAIDKNEKKYKIDYRSAWRDTLGRDIRPICRFCMDGIGDMADVVCYDAWFLGTDHKPLFDEADGRNGVFCRTGKGLKIFEEAINKGYIVTSDYKSYVKELRMIQKYQFVRRVTLPSTILAMKVLLKTTPTYPFSYMISLMKYGSLKMQVSRFKGTIKRIISGRI